MVNVRVSGNDVAHLQIVLRKDLLHAVDLVAGIDDDGFLRCVVSHNRAVALQYPNRQNFMEHSPCYSNSLARNRSWIVNAHPCRVFVSWPAAALKAWYPRDGHTGGYELPFVKRVRFSERTEACRCSANEPRPN